MNIKTYILNMPQRLERREAIAREFLGRRIFDVEFCEPVHHVNPRISHWLTMQRLAERAMAQQRPCFLFCEDDHIFTEAYSDQLLTSCIREADTLGADLLLGSVSWMLSPIQIRQSLFWLESFNGTQFVIVFNRFYERIVNFHLHANDTVTEMNLSDRRWRFCRWNRQKLRRFEFVKTVDKSLSTVLTNFFFLQIRVKLLYLQQKSKTLQLC